MKKTLILSLVLFSMAAQAVEQRKSIECLTHIMTANKSGIQTKKINLLVKLDKDGNGETIVKNSNYEATISINEDTDLKNLYYMAMSVEDKINTLPDPRRTNQISSTALVVPRKYKYEEGSRLALMSSMYRDDNSGGKALFTPSALLKMYTINNNYNEHVESVMGLGNGYNEVVMAAVKAGTIKSGELLGLIVYDLCK